MTEPTAEHDTTPELDAQDDIDTEPELPDLPVTPATEQHPALDGDVQGEIEHRTPEATDDNMFTKTFVVGAIGISDAHPMHLANAGGVVQEAVQRGLHPKGDVTLVASEEHDLGRRGQYTDLTYQVKVVPAVVDDDAGSTVTQRMIAEAVAARHETEQTQIVGEHGPEIDVPQAAAAEKPPQEQ